MRTERLCAWHVARRPAFHDKLTALREGMSEGNSVIKKGETCVWQKGGHILRKEETPEQSSSLLVPRIPLS